VKLIALLIKPIAVSVGLIAISPFSHAGLPEVEFFAVAVDPPTTTGAESQRISIVTTLIWLKPAYR
jgi:hypothetical protein